MKLIVLGSGTSTGVPRIGNEWGRCDPTEPKNRRSRVSIIVESAAGARILVDTSPDLRQQLLANEIASVDAVVWTHDHADHCHGIDDLRPMRFHRDDLFSGIDVLVTDCLRREPHPTHSNLAQAVEFGQRTAAGVTVLTHLDKSMDYAEVSAETPDSVIVAYDGMELEL